MFSRVSGGVWCLRGIRWVSGGVLWVVGGVQGVSGGYLMGVQGVSHEVSSGYFGQCGNGEES